MFIGSNRRTDQHHIATIGGNKNSASGMGTVQWRWKDDNRKVHTMDIESVLYFPQSPVNILSLTTLAEKLKDDNGTGINTKKTDQRTINHPP